MNDGRPAYLPTCISSVDRILTKQHIGQRLIVYLLLNHWCGEHHLRSRHRRRNKLCSNEVSAAIAGLVAVRWGTKTALSAVAGMSRGVKGNAAAADS